MEFVKLENKSWGVFGLKGMGKSVFLEQALKNLKRTLIFDPLDEHKTGVRYVPEFREGEEAKTELNEVVRAWVAPTDRKVKTFVVDEINRYCPVRESLPAAISDLNDFARHWKVSFGFAARRPAQVNTNLIEIADYLIIFKLDGYNDIRMLNDTRQGMGDLVTTLNPYEYVFYDRNEAIKCPKLTI